MRNVLEDIFDSFFFVFFVDFCESPLCLLENLELLRLAVKLSADIRQ